MRASCSISPNKVIKNGGSDLQAQTLNQSKSSLHTYLATQWRFFSFNQKNRLPVARMLVPKLELDGSTVQ